jgi:hypothetical protein
VFRSFIALYEVPLKDIKNVGAWYALSTCKRVGAILFKETTNFKHCIQLILTSFRDLAEE